MQPNKIKAPRSTKDASLLADAASLHSAVTELVRVYQYRDRDRICCYDVTVTQCHALEVLVEKGPMRSQALAATLRLDKSTTSRVIDALERKSYVERAADSTDARALALQVTKSGRTLYQAINRDLINLQAELVRDLDPDIRAGAADVIRRLARAAEARFVNGQNVRGCESSPGLAVVHSADG